SIAVLTKLYRLVQVIYVDEAYRYATKSIAETLQSLRKFKIYMTLANQYIGQYRRDTQEAVIQTCETIISFRVDEESPRAPKWSRKRMAVSSFCSILMLCRDLFRLCW
ncbi:MAG: hypothetical protein LBE76_01465, partial [Nitrososphaerota archaeon]|nr:hypothetical protein [Nitrososphaerota archaeon]